MLTLDHSNESLRALKLYAPSVRWFRFPRRCYGDSEVADRTISMIVNSAQALAGLTPQDFRSRSTMLRKACCAA